MKRRYFYYLAALIVSVLCLFPLSALGNPIDVEQALKAVENYRKKPAPGGARRAPAFAKGKLQHAYTKKTAAGAPAVYVFNTGEGFILASADDATVPVLGYSDNGDFDPDNIPDGLRYMLGEYAKQMAALPPRKAGAALPTPTYEVESTVAVSPLIQSHWDQQEPYNIECPPALSPTGRAATGCMTTAIAQIMRYHQWPQTKGFSSREMEAAQGATTSSQVRDYYLRNYQWDLMHYNASQYTKTSGGGYNFSASDVKAVSQLMMDVAVGLSTEFGGTSSAVNIAIIPMLLSYFNYDASIEEVKLSKCNSVEEFNHIVITDLLAGRPVYFQGGPNSSGHAFVCDGYDGEGRFHINWGWSGTADGYFLITGLSPSEAGTGGVANNGYSENLLAIHNIMPCRDGVLARPEVKAYYASDIAPGYEIARENNNYYFRGTFGVYPQLPSQRNFRGKIGLYVVDSYGQGQEVWDATQEYTQILRTNPYHDFKVKLQSDWAEEGTHIYYIYKECGADSWKYMYTTRGDQCCFSIEVNADGELVAVANNMEYNLDALIGGTTPTVQITYNVNLNGNSIGSITVAEKIGQAPSKSFVPEYYVETSGFPDEVPSTATTYTINSNYNSKLPFTPGTTAYNVTFNTDGNSYLWYDNGTPHEQMNAAASAGDNANAQWRFQGDWLNGFTIQNVGTSKYITTMDDETSNARTLSAPSPLSGRSYFLLQHRNDGFYFKLKDSELYLAHTNSTKLEISSFNQKGYSGNLVTFTQPGNVPQPTGVTYTVDISGQPEDATPVVYYGTQSYGDGSQFTAVNLDSSSLYASPIEGYTAEINVGAGTVYVVYTANANTSVTYSVSITGYPSGQAPQLFYNGQPVVGTTLTAYDLLLSQLSATHIDNYTCDIRIASKSITVTYTAISYVTYTVNFTGVPTGQSPKLYYNGQAVSGTQFTAGNLTLEQLYADALTDYGYKISISGSTITVMYYPLEFYFDTTGAYGITTLTKEPVTVRYYGYEGKNNIFSTTTQYTEVKSTGEPIVKIVFAGIENFSGINASVGTLDRTTGVWTSPEGGVASVRFTGGDGYSTGLTVSLKSSDTPTPTPTTYSISFSGHPTGQSPQLYYNDEAVSGTQLTATNLNISQLSATTIAGYTYHISIGTNTISVVYTANAPAGTTYTVSIVGAPSGYSPQLYYNGEAVSGTQFTATSLSLTQLSATNIPGYSYDIVIGTSTVTVTYTAVGTTYTVSIVGAPSGYSPVLNFGTSSYAHGQQFTATSLSLTQLSATTIPGYSYDIVIGTSTVTVTYTAVGTTYTVSIVGAPSGYSPVLNFGTSSYAHGQQFTATSLSLTQLSATTIPGYSYNIVIGTSTVTVTYTADAPAGTTYTVSIVGAPSDYSPVLNYGTSSYAHGQQFTATSLSLTQLSATTIPGYSYNIVIGTSTVTVTYTELPYQVGKQYVMKSVGHGTSGPYYVLPPTTTGNCTISANEPSSSQTWTVRSCIDNGDGSYDVSLENNGNYFAFMSTVTTAHSVKLNKFDVDNTQYWNVQDYLNYWPPKSSDTRFLYIAVKSSDGDIGWGSAVGSQIRSTGFSYQFSLEEYVDPSTTYTVSIVGAPSGYTPVLNYGTSSYAHGQQFTATSLSLTQLSATSIPGYSYDIVIGTSTVTVTYTAISSEGYHFETTESGSNGRKYFSDGPVSGSYYAYYGRNNIYGSSWYTEVTSSGEPIASIAFDNIQDFSGVVPSTGTLNTSKGIWTASGSDTYYVKFTGGDGYSTGLTVNLMSSGPTTYTVVVNDLPSGGAVTLNGQDLTTGGTYTVSKTLSLSDLSVTEPDGYYAETAYDPATHTFTVTFHECYLYPVVVVGTSNAAAGVVYDGVTYHHGESIQAKTPLYATSVTPASVTGQEGSVTFENGTFTVTYRLMKAVDVYFYREGVYSSERYTFQKEGVNVTCWNYNPGWPEYASANVYPSDNYSLIVSSEFAISKIEMYLCTTGGYTNSGKFSNFSATNGYFSPNGDMATWTGSANEVTFTVSTGDIYIGHMVIYIAGPTEEEQALQEIEEARVEIADGSLGYPVLTQALRSDANMAAYVAYYDDPTGYTGTLADLQASYDYFLTHCDEVNRPAPGHAYKLSVRSSDGTKRWYLTNNGSVSETAADAAVFVMGGTANEDYASLFATNDNSQSHYLQNNGATATAYTANTCDFALASMLHAEQGTLVNTQPASRLGTFSLTSSARHDDATLPGTLVIDESNETWSKADTPFMNGTYSSAIEMEEVEYPYTRPNLVSGTEGSHEGVFATVWLPFPMIFPEGVEVYKGTQQHTGGGQSYLALERVDTDHAVARGGYILYSETLEAGAIDVLPAPSAPTDTHLDTDAVFIGSTDLNTDGSSLYWTLLAGKNPYVLANKSKGIGFYRYTGTTFPKGKAIWLAPEPETAETVKFGFEDVIEAIKSLHGHGSDTLIYDLNGHRLEKLQKGQVNVVNGKRIMIK